MGPIMPSIAMASTPAWAMDGKANNPERYFGKSVGKVTEKGSPLGWKAGQTFFGMMIDQSPGHWGNKVLSADVNQLMIPAMYLQQFAHTPKYHQDKINQIVAEANGFDTKEEMKSWIMSNLSDAYKEELIDEVMAKARDSKEVIQVAMVNTVDGVTTFTGHSIDDIKAHWTFISDDDNVLTSEEIATAVDQLEEFVSTQHSVIDLQAAYDTAVGLGFEFENTPAVFSTLADLAYSALVNPTIDDVRSTWDRWSSPSDIEPYSDAFNIALQQLEGFLATNPSATELRAAYAAIIDTGTFEANSPDGVHAAITALSDAVYPVEDVLPNNWAPGKAQELRTNVGGIMTNYYNYADPQPTTPAEFHTAKQISVDYEAIATITHELDLEKAVGYFVTDNIKQTIDLSSTISHAITNVIEDVIEDGKLVSVHSGIDDVVINFNAFDNTVSIAENALLAGIAVELGLAAGIAAGLDLSTLALAAEAVETLTSAGVDAGLDEGVARDAAENAVEEESGYTKEQLQNAAP